MVARFSVGPSSYGDLRGVEQFVASERMALQILSVKVDFDQWKADQGSGDRLTINEGMRSRARQDLLYAEYRQSGYPVAAVPYTSRHDEVRNGNAIDVGVTMANGQNRALTADEFAKVHGWFEQRGGTWTGVNFGEPWHHEMATRSEQLPPYPNARELVAAGPNRPKPTTPVPPAAPPDPYFEIGEDTMQMVTVAGSAPLGGDIAVLDGLRAAYHTQGEQDAYRQGRSMGILKPGQNKDAAIRGRLTDLGLNIGVDELQARLRAIKKAGGTVDPYYDGKF